MLVFDYQCTKCKTIEEHYVKRHDDSPHCTVCGHVMEKSTPAVGLLKTKFQNKNSVRKSK